MAGLAILGIRGGLTGAARRGRCLHYGVLCGRTCTGTGNPGYLYPGWVNRCCRLGEQARRAARRGRCLHYGVLCGRMAVQTVATFFASIYLFF